MNRSWSLRGRLITLLTVAALATWAASSLWLYRTAMTESERLFDAAMVETAYSLMAVLAHEIGEEESEENEPELELQTIDHAHEESLYFHVRKLDGRLLFRSPGSPQGPFTNVDSHGMHDRAVGGTLYRVYTLANAEVGVAVDVAQPAPDRMRLARGAAIRLLAPGIALAGLLALGVWVIVRRVTAPIVSYSALIDARAPGDASKLPAGDLPDELRPMARAIDGLLQRVDSALLYERTLTADAAHELRTPLAALRAQAQVAVRARDADERTLALQALMSGVDRAARIFDGVLSLARLDAQRLDRSNLTPVDLPRLVQMVVTERSGEIHKRALVVQTELQPILDRVDADAVALLLRNLLDNAIRHAAKQIRIDLKTMGPMVVLSVADDGPGMSAEQIERGFDRFYRSTSGPGAGLGLALVKRVAELHGGGASLAPHFEGPGLVVEASWSLR